MPDTDFRIRSWLADDLIAYLDEIEATLAENTLLGRRLDAADETARLRVPLSVVEYDQREEADEVRAREHLRFDGRPVRDREKEDDDGGEDDPRTRLSSARRKEKRETRPQRLFDLMPKLTHAVILGDPGSGKSEFLKRHVRDVANQARESFRRQTVPVEAVSLPVFVTLADLGRQLLAIEQNPGSAYRKLISRLDRSGVEYDERKPMHRVGAALLLAASKMFPTAESPRVESQLWAALTAPGHPLTGTRAVICLDGWDEAIAYQTMLARDLRAHANAGVAVRLFATSRVAGYQLASKPLFTPGGASAVADESRRQPAVHRLRAIEGQQAAAPPRKPLTLRHSQL